MTAKVPCNGPGFVRFDEESRERFRACGWWTGRTLPAELVEAVSLHADAVGLVTPEVEWKYGEILSRATSFAAGLARSFGLKPGDSVMFQMGNVAETVVAYVGCLMAGARPVCTLPHHGVREIGLLAKHTGASLLIAQGDFDDGRLLRQARQLLADGSVQGVVVARAGSVSGATAYDTVLSTGEGADLTELPYANGDPESIAVFQLSGGTTGLPKVAPRLHEEYAYNSLAWARAMSYGSDSCVLYPLPLMHNAGISLALQPAFLTGARLVLAPSADVDTVIDLVRAHRPNVLPVVPPAVAIRLLESTAVRAEDFASVRDFVVGGQKLPLEVAEMLHERLRIRVRQMFGMAEGLFMLTPATASEGVRHNTVGAPISAGDEVRILDPLGENEVPDGTVGELAARGPYTIRGYYRAPTHNETVFTADGFYRTGDLARRQVTSEGVFYSIEGRLKDVINRGVEKIHAEEVEELIVQHPSVMTAALVAMPDPVLGERGCAYLVVVPGARPLDVATLGEHLLGLGLAKYKLPERVEIVSALPLTNVGKVSKMDLRDDIQKRLALERDGPH